MCAKFSISKVALCSCSGPWYFNKMVAQNHLPSEIHVRKMLSVNLSEWRIYRQIGSYVRAQGDLSYHLIEVPCSGPHLLAKLLLLANANYHQNPLQIRPDKSWEQNNLEQEQEHTNLEQGQEQETGAEPSANVDFFYKRVFSNEVFLSDPRVSHLSIQFRIPPIIIYVYCMSKKS